MTGDFGDIPRSLVITSIRILFSPDYRCTLTAMFPSAGAIAATRGELSNGSNTARTQYEDIRRSSTNK